MTAVPIEKRNVTKARREKIIAGQHGVCKRAFCDLAAVDVDHITPLWMGGTNRDDNLEGLCPAHHKAKTSLEARIRGRVNRIVARLEGTRRPRKAIPSRPFPEGKRAIPSRPFEKREKHD